MPDQQRNDQCIFLGKDPAVRERVRFCGTGQGRRDAGKEHYDIVFATSTAALPGMDGSEISGGGKDRL